MRHRPPFIPYLGVHLTDLTFVGDGNDDVLPDGAINLGKRQNVHAILSTCLGGRARVYPFSALPGIVRLFEAAPRLSEDELYRQSLHWEPRGMAPQEVAKRDQQLRNAPTATVPSHPPPSASTAPGTCMASAEVVAVEDGAEQEHEQSTSMV